MKLLKELFHLFLKPSGSSDNGVGKTSPFVCFNEVLDYMPDAFIIIIDRRGIVTHVNKLCCDLLGYKKEEIIGQSASMFFVRKENGNGVRLYPTKKDDEVYLGKILDELVLNGYVNNLEVEFVTKECCRIPMLFNGVVLRDEKKEITGVLGIARDMRHITRYIEKLRLIRGLTLIALRDLPLEDAIEDIFQYVKKYFKVERGTVYLNIRGYLKSVFASGYDSSREGPIVLNIGEGISGYVAKSCKPYYTNEAYQDSYFSRKIDDKTGYKTKNLLAVPITDPRGSLVAVAELLNKNGDFNNEDVKDFEEIVELARLILTTRFQKEELQKDITVLKLISDISSKAISSETFEKFIEYTFALVGSYLKSSRICLFTYENKNDGSGIFKKGYMWNVHGNKNSESNLSCVEGQFNLDKVVKAALIENQVVCMCNGSSAGIKDFFQGQQNITLVNFDNTGFCGYYEKCHVKCAFLLPVLVASKLIGVMCVDYSGIDFGKKEFAERDISMLQTVSGIISAVLRQEESIKENNILLSRVAHTARLISIGELAAGVAHEIGNPLQTILGNAELLLMNYPQSDEIKSIVEAARQTKMIIENLLDFARYKKDGDYTCLNINEIVDKALSLFGKQLKLDKIQVVKKLDKSLPPVLVSAPRMTQVFMNIISNARKAMPRGGTLTISSYLIKGRKNTVGDIIVVDDVPRASDTIKDVSNGNRAVKEWVVVEFSDTGVGIKPEDIPRLVEPFYTTRKGGTGLGLSVSYGIVKQHNGEMMISSEGEGQGAVVKILLPVNSSDDFIVNNSTNDHSIDK